MDLVLFLATYLSAACFFYYGLKLLLSQDMVAEFERYGLTKFRRLVGWLQLAGCFGLVIGAYFPLLTTAASLGLASLMALGVFARIRVHDTIIDMLPAIVLFAVNALVFLRSL